MNGRLDTIKYIHFLEILRNAAGSENSISLIHDHNPVHRSRAVCTWFEAHPQFVIIPIPKKSGDCNILQDIWTLLIKHINYNARHLDSVDLCDIMEEAWNTIVTMDTIENLNANMSTRLIRIIEKNGAINI